MFEWWAVAVGFGGGCWDLVYVDGWFWRIGGVYYMPVVLRVGSVDSVDVNLWVGGLCCVVVVVLVFATVWVGEVGGCSMG